MRILLTGASGQLGAYLIDRLLAAKHDIVAWSGSTEGSRQGVAFRRVDLADTPATDRAIEAAAPEVILHAAAISSAEVAWRDPDRAWAVNVEATARLVDWADRRGGRVIFTSTDLVFDGSKGWNREDDPAEPLLAYGVTKREAERAVLGSSRGVVARLSLLYGTSRSGRPSYFDQSIEALRRGEPRSFFEDEYRTPLDLATAAEVLVRLAECEFRGVIHVGGRERLSRFELMRRAAACLGIDPALVRASRRADAASPEPRPADVSLDTSLLASTFPDLARPPVGETWPAG